MIADVILGLGNGYEQKYNTIQELSNNEIYDICIKYGENNIPQTFTYNNTIMTLHILPSTILYHIPCFIDSGEPIDIDLLKKDIEQVSKFIIDIDIYLFLSKVTLIKHNTHILKYDNLEPHKIIKLIGCLPNKVSLNRLLPKYNRPLYISSNGFYGQDGYTQLSGNPKQSNAIFSIINTRKLGNIIGVVNIYETFNSFKKKNILKIYEEIITMDTNEYLLNYDWLDLDKLIYSIQTSGINIVYIIGTHILKNISVMCVYKNNSLLEFDNIEIYYEYLIKELLLIEGISQIFIK